MEHRALLPQEQARERRVGDEDAGDAIRCTRPGSRTYRGKLPGREKRALASGRRASALTRLTPASIFRHLDRIPAGSSKLTSRDATPAIVVASAQSPEPDLRRVVLR